MATSRLDDFDPIAGETFEEFQGAKAAQPGSGQKLIANVIRLGVPTAIAMRGGGTAAVPAAALGEFLAREIEQYEDLSSLPPVVAPETLTRESYDYSNPDFQSAIRHLQNTAWGAGAGIAELGALKVLAPAVSKLGQGVMNILRVSPFRMNPERFPTEVQRAIRVTSELTGENLATGAGGVITPTLGQITRSERGLWAWLDATARSAIGPGRQMQKFTDRMIGAVQNKLNSFLGTAATQMDSAEFGTLQRQLLTGEMDVVSSVRNWLYNGFRTQAVQDAATANLSTVRQTLFDANAHLGENLTKDRMLHKVWNNLKADLNNFGLDVRTTVGWSNVPASAAERIRFRINEVLSENLSKTEFNTVNAIAKEAKAALESAVSGKTSGEWLKAADTFGGTSAERLEKGLMADVFKSIAEKPADVINLLNTPKKYDTLLAVKNAYANADLSMLAPLRARGINVPAGTTLNQTLYEENVLKPLRHSIISKAVDPTTNLINGRSLARIIDTAEKKDGGAFLNEVFSTQGRPFLETMKNFAYTLKVLEERHVGEKVFISLIQGGQLVSAGTMGVAALAGTNTPGGGGMGDWLRRTAIGASVVFMTPFALSALLTRPTLTRTVIDGFVRGPKTTAFSRAIATIGTLNEQSKHAMSKLPAHALDFYSRMQNPEAIQPTAEQYPPPGGPLGM